VPCCAGKKQQKGSGAQLKTKDWIVKKKAQMRQKGYTSIPVDTKYTGRKRKKLV
jgi:18S rRNA (guanine1575-N7)-methyltransferase